ncbi:MAG TPA: M43 family zinc metalloprotease, partial [Rubricoccaceae bacterium]|nr:M43 family zinc metalloprotease [Rubricoccaceae bacterium]
MPTSLRARWAAWALLLLLFGSTAPALQAQSLDQGPRCATPEPTEAEARSAYEAVRAWLQQHPTPPEGGVVTIPVAFHVIYSGGQGNVPESQIVDQIERFNIEFASFGYQFVLAVLDRTENAQWFVDAPNQEFAMKQALAVAPAHFLNVYTANLQGGLLGWATFPNSYPEDHFLHGVVIHYQTLPGGGYPNYGTGDTAIHEVGHYVGLYHTFQGGCAGGDTPPGCETGGDQVCDTAAQSAPTWNCPPGYNSCPTGGPDPLNNFMSYAGDACLFEFTDGQITRSLALMSQFRPTIMSSPDAFAAPATLAFVNVRLGESETKRVHVVNLTDDPLLVAAIETDNDAFAADATSLTV